MSDAEPTDLFYAVDPFLGNEGLDLPDPQGIAATWFLPKAQNGNTHPGAVTPFGMVSVAPYSGAYITGYGLYRLNTHGEAPKMHDRYVASGFTHFQQSGTENIVKFYKLSPCNAVAGAFALIIAGALLGFSRRTRRPGYLPLPFTRT